MASDPAFSDDVTDRLTPLGPVRAKRMFGGFGIFLDDLMFGLIADDRLYLKVDDGNRPAFEAAASRPFTYEGRSKPMEMSYWLVPNTVFDDRAALIDWAEAARQAARRAKKPKTGKRKTKKKD